MEIEQEKSIENQLSNLLKDVMRLANYAVETNRLPNDIQLSELYRMWAHKIEQGKALIDSDINLLEYYYRVLENELTPVTAISLLATECRFGKSSMKTEGGKHARNMWLIAFAVLALILAINLFQYVFEFFSADWSVSWPSGLTVLSIVYWFALSIAPFAYGAFGATIRLLRVTERRLHDRSFDPRRLPEHRNRLVLGTLSGGAIVMLYSSGGIGETDVKITEIALGFLAGYSIDLLFSILDGLVNLFTFSSPKEASSKSNVTPLRIEQKPFEVQKTNDSATPIKQGNSSIITSTPHLKPVSTKE